MQHPRYAQAQRTCFAAASALAVAVAGFSAQAAGVPQEAGVWIDDTGKGAVKIEPCGAKLCGKIVWLKDKVNAEGKPLIDRHNPDQSKQSRPICGLAIIGDLSPVPEGGFDGGWIYDPKEGKSYSAAIVAAGPAQLKVTGYLGVKFLGQSFMWTRADVELPSCAAGPQETRAPAAPPAATTQPLAKSAATVAAAAAADKAARAPAPPPAHLADPDDLTPGTEPAAPKAVKSIKVSPPPPAAKPTTAAPKPAVTTTKSAATLGGKPTNADVKKVAVKKPVEAEVLPWAATTKPAVAVAKPAPAKKDAAKKPAAKTAATATDKSAIQIKKPAATNDTATSPETTQPRPAEEISN